MAGIAPESYGDISTRSKPSGGPVAAELDSSQLPLNIAVVGQEPIKGRLIWQEPEFLAIERAGASRPVLINRRQISVIRSLR